MDEEVDYSEFGRCPNCGTTVHISQLGNEGGMTCCFACYESLREYQCQEAEEYSIIQHKPHKT